MLTAGARTSSRMASGKRCVLVAMVVGWAQDSSAFQHPEHLEGKGAMGCG